MFCSKLRYYKTENWSLVTWHWLSAFYNDKPLNNRTEVSTQASLLATTSSIEFTNILIETWWIDFLSLLWNILEKISENSEINLQYFIPTYYYTCWVSFLTLVNPLQLELYILKLKHWIVWLVLLITWTILGNFLMGWGGKRNIKENTFGSKNL